MDRDQPSPVVTPEALPARFKLKLFVYFSASFLMISESFMLIRAHEAHITLAFLPLLAMAGSLTQALLSYYAGKSADELGDEKSFALGYRLDEHWKCQA